MRLFIVFADMKIVHKRNLKNFGTIDSVHSNVFLTLKLFITVKMFNKILLKCYNVDMKKIILRKSIMYDKRITINWYCENTTEEE